MTAAIHEHSVCAERSQNKFQVRTWSINIWCMCDRASYMRMMRGTNLMQQLW